MTKYFKKLSEMSPKERSDYFRKIGQKGGLASKAAGADYRKLSKKSWRTRRKGLSTE